MRRMGRAATAVLGLSAVLACLAPATAQEPALERELAVQVRAAALGEVTTQLSRAAGVALEVAPSLAAQRVTLYAPRTTVASLQQALASLARGRWRRMEEEAGARYRLEPDERLQARATQLAEQRRAGLVAGLLQMETWLRRAPEETVVRAIRAGVARRLPILPVATLEEITPDYLRQTWLLAPLRRGLSLGLARTGTVAVPLVRLSAAEQNLFAAFFLEQTMPSLPDGNAVAAPGLPNGFFSAEAFLAPLLHPRARVEYRILYGDRWTGTLLLTRVGVGDTWATAVLPSVLLDLPDYATLYPEAAARPADPALDRPLDLEIDPGASTWDHALTTIARAAEIRVVCDSYIRPEVFRPEGDAPPIRGATVRQLLDRVAERYGYVWWKAGEWYVFRHRYWAEEARVTVPERVSLQIASSLASRRELAPEDFAALARLDDEQLLTMHLYGMAAGRSFAPVTAFDVTEIEVARAGLGLLAQMNDQQREMARAGGVPYSLLSPQQQATFTALAYERGRVPAAFEADRWRFRVTERFRRQRMPAGWAELGTLEFTFESGPSGTPGWSRSARLALRVPAREPAPDLQER